MPNRIEDKRQLLMAELQRYFGETCPALAAAIVGLAPGVLRELSGRLQTFGALMDETNRQLKAAQATAFENQESAETLLDRARASLEHLNEVAQSITRDLEELPKT